MSTTTTPTPKPPTRPAKRADSAISLSFSPSTSTSTQHATQAVYDAEWSAYLGLEDDWGYVLKDSRGVKSTRRDAEADMGQRYEEEWRMHLGLDGSGEW